MARKIYRFPPLTVTSSRLDWETPIRRSRYALGGDTEVSTAGPVRRTLSLQLPALDSGARAGAGYFDEMIRILAGVHLLRVPLPPVNWHLDRQEAQGWGSDRPLTVVTPPDDLDIETPPDPLRVWEGWARPLTVLSSAVTEWPGLVQVTGLPPSRNIARPGDILRVWTNHATGAFSSAVVAELARSNIDGVAQIYLDRTVPAGVASFGDALTDVFEVIGHASGAQGVGGQWSATLDLRQKLPAEITGLSEVALWQS